MKTGGTPVHPTTRCLSWIFFSRKTPVPDYRKRDGVTLPPLIVVISFLLYDQVDRVSSVHTLRSRHTDVAHGRKVQADGDRSDPTYPTASSVCPCKSLTRKGSPTALEYSLERVGPLWVPL